MSIVDAIPASLEPMPDALPVAVFDADRDVLAKHIGADWLKVDGELGPELLLPVDIGGRRAVLETTESSAAVSLTASPDLDDDELDEMITALGVPLDEVLDRPCHRKSQVPDVHSRTFRAMVEKVQNAVQEAVARGEAPARSEDASPSNERRAGNSSSTSGQRALTGASAVRKAASGRSGRRRVRVTDTDRVTVLGKSSGVHHIPVVAPDGDKIGELDRFYEGRSSGEPTFAAVKTGLFGSKLSLVPIQGAVFVDDGLEVFG